MATPEEKIVNRLAALMRGTPFSAGSFIEPTNVSLATAWFIGCGHAIAAATGKRGLHWEQAELLLEDLAPPIGTDKVARMSGVLNATYQDLTSGMLTDVRYSIYAETFDDFLDIAEDLHKSGKTIEPAVLASAVLEDTFKNIAAKNSVDPEGLSLEQIINDLAKQGTLTGVEAKRAKAYAGVRKHAFHAEWDDLDLRSVGEAILGIRGFIESHLS